MITGIIGMILPIVLKLVERWLDKKKLERSTVEAFYKFIEKLDKDSTSSVKLSISYASQLKKLKEQAKKSKNN